MSDTVVYLNELPNDDLDLFVTGVGDAWSGPAVDRSVTPIIGRLGVVASSTATGRAKVISLAMGLSANMAERRAKFDAVLRHLDGLVEVEWDDAPGRIQKARLDATAARALFAQQAYVDGELAIDLQLILDSPVSWAKDLSRVPVGSVAEKLLLGTVPSVGTFYFPGATSNLSVTYRHGLTGVVLSSLVLNGTTGSGTVTEIDADLERIYTWDTTTGARVNRLRTTGLYSSGSFPVFDPGDGTPEFPPTIESNHSGFVDYLRAWQ